MCRSAGKERGIECPVDAAFERDGRAVIDTTTSTRPMMRPAQRWATRMRFRMVHEDGMRRGAMQGIVTLALSLLLPAALAAQSADVPLTLVDENRAAVPVMINGRGPYLFAI